MPAFKLKKAVSPMLNQYENKYQGPIQGDQQITAAPGSYKGHQPASGLINSRQKQFGEMQALADRYSNSIHPIQLARKKPKNQQKRLLNSLMKQKQTFYQNP
ncbi:hypothetical protein [Chitinimonas naiadis]